MTTFSHSPTQKPYYSTPHQPAQAVSIIQRYIGEGANKACEVLIETAAQRWREYEGDYRDDITAVVVKVQEIFQAVDEEDAKIEADIAEMWDGNQP